MGLRQGLTSRSARIAAAAVAITAVLLPGTAIGQQHDPHDPHDPGDGMLPPGDWTEAEKADLLDLIADAERDLPQFGDPDELPEGFHDFGVTVAGYYHYINPDYIDDEHILDPNFPESLVYHREYDPDTGQPGEFHLVSAMFILPSEYDDTNIPEDIAWMPGWHTHPDVCVTEDYRFAGLTSPGTPCSSGRAWEKPPMMHVWIAMSPCDHRFGGIDVGGVHCHVDGTPGGKPTPTPTPTPTPSPTPSPTPTPTSTSTTAPGQSNPRPATPVAGRPNLTG